jgi:hypothetical protein
MTDASEVPVDLPIAPRLAAAVTRFGEPTVVLRSLSLIAGNNEGDEFLLYVGGDHARGILNGAPPLYWPELWGTRALLYVWDDSASLAVTAALENQAWRVREMATRVAALRELPVLEQLTTLLTDDVSRVRAAAARAIGALGAAEQIETIRPLLKDGEIEVRRSAQHAITQLRDQ